jgi:catechol 2,3-dioxygenase-like lactoylglutathione lyase family enzyme
MIAYATLGTNDFARACTYYDALLGELGGQRFLETDRIVLWASGPDAPMMAVCTPYDEQAATPGNGTMIALAAGSREDVDRLHRKALELGGSTEGEPGVRAERFYIGYFRDPDGNKLCFFAPA